MDDAKRYRCLKPLEHVKLRPGMYVGSTAPSMSERWVIDHSDGQFKSRRVDKEMVPALLKIFDEVVSNAGDAAQRDENVTTITIGAVVLEQKLTFSVRNDGRGVPTDLDETMKIPVAQMIVGELLAGENFGDDREKVVGQNGLGGKLANIFSTSFKASTRHAPTGNVWNGEWKDGMELVSSKVKTGTPGKAGFFDVFFVPNQELTVGATDDDAMAVYLRRALDLAVTVRPGVSVTFNGIKLCTEKKPLEFKKYATILLGAGAVVRESNGWCVAIAPSASPVSIGLINGVSSHGRHIVHAEGELYGAIIKAVASKRNSKGLKLTVPSLRAHASLLVVANVNAPTFTSQTKERCDGWSKQGTTLWETDEKFVEKIIKTEIVTNAVDAVQASTTKKLAKATDGSKKRNVDVPKLRDASEAGRGAGAPL